MRAALIRARSGLALRVELAEEATEATEATHNPGTMAQLILTHPIREVLGAQPERGVEEEVEEVPHTYLAALAAVAVAAAAEVLREIRVTREIRAVQLIPQHTIAFQLLVAHPIQ